eukprot:g34135.t1
MNPGRGYTQVAPDRAIHVTGTPNRQDSPLELILTSNCSSRSRLLTLQPCSHRPKTHRTNMKSIIRLRQQLT